MDYALKHRIGNLLEQDYYDMLASGRLARLVGENIDPRFSRNSLCKICDWAKLHHVQAVRQFWHNAM
ncbi:hypothetical protein [Rhodopila sp.]|uniref:hypothetical protein n=1 Tax=Rhodopila sp. TaxID=2480087 RepID=UPI003D0EEAD7